MHLTPHVKRSSAVHPSALVSFWHRWSFVQICTGPVPVYCTVPVQYYHLHKLKNTRKLPGVKCFAVMFMDRTYWDRQGWICMTQRIKTLVVCLSLVKLDTLPGFISILSPHFLQLPESAQSSDVNNEMLIWSIASSPEKNPSQKSPLLQTYPSKRDMSWCFCKEMLRQGCFCYKKDVPVTGSCCATPRTRLQIGITSLETSQAPGFWMFIIGWWNERGPRRFREESQE